jgi:hypothetical protein
MIQTIPVTSAPNQLFAIPLSVDGASLSLILALHFNEVANYWVMTVSDANSNVLVDSVPLVTGNWPVCNILKQYAFLQIGSCYIINVTGNAGGNPNSTNLGNGYIMLWGDTP